MIEIICANIFETLGIGWEKILLYLANFAVLCLGLTFLLYKPVKKFMQKRKDEIAGEYAAAEKAMKDVEQVKTDCEEQVKTANEEVKQKNLELRHAKEELLVEKEAIISDANKKAEELILQAKEQAEADRKHAVEKAREDVVNMAISLAGNILEREVKAEDNEKLIGDAIEEWTKND